MGVHFAPLVFLQDVMKDIFILSHVLTSAAYKMSCFA